jgi:pimeloyl-ACP methyl ester carboxylesterase
MLAMAQNGFRAVAYDRRGHGRSSDPGRGYDHDTLADDLARVIAGRSLDGVTVIAHSMGATEIARYFSRHGGRGVSRVVLVGTITPFLMQTADNPNGVDRQILAAMRAPIAHNFPAWMEANAAPFFTPETSPDLIAWVKSLMLQTSLYGALELARANAETDFRSDVEAINVPTLLIHGDRDASAPLPLTAQATAALIPSSRLEVYAGAPHGLPLTHVERLNNDLLSFARG